MINNETIKRNQHYLPKAYLQFFAHSDKKTKMTYVYFSHSKQIKYVPIDNICNQSYLYEEIAIEPETDSHVFMHPNEMENSFIPLEGNYATIIRTLLQNLKSYGEPRLSAKDCDALKQFIASIIARNPLFVHLSNYIARTMYDKNATYFQQLKSKFSDISDGIILSMAATEILKLFIHPQQGILNRSMDATIENSKLCILKTNSAVFITSDSPVVNIWGENNGIEFDLLGMPITSNLFLAFVDIDDDIPELFYIDEQAVRAINNRQARPISKLFISNNKNILSYIDLIPDNDNDESDNDWLFDMLQIDKETFLKQYSDFKKSKDNHYWE